MLPGRQPSSEPRLRSPQAWYSPDDSIRQHCFRRLTHVALIALPFACSNAANASVTWKDISSSSTISCLFVAKNSSRPESPSLTLMFASGDKGGVFFGVSDPKWNLPKSKSYDLEFRVDDSEQDRRNFVSLAGKHLLTPLQDADIAVLLRGNRIKIGPPNDSLSVDLEGLQEGLSDLRLCAENLQSESHDGTPTETSQPSWLNGDEAIESEADAPASEDQGGLGRQAGAPRSMGRLQRGLPMGKHDEWLASTHGEAYILENSSGRGTRWYTLRTDDSDYHFSVRVYLEPGERDEGRVNGAGLITYCSDDATQYVYIMQVDMTIAAFRSTEDGYARLFMIGGDSIKANKANALEMTVLSSGERKFSINGDQISTTDTSENCTESYYGIFVAGRGPFAFKDFGYEAD